MDPPQIAHLKNNELISGPSLTPFSELHSSQQPKANTNLSNTPPKIYSNIIAQNTTQIQALPELDQSKMKDQPPEEGLSICHIGIQQKNQEMAQQVQAQTQSIIELKNYSNDLNLKQDPNNEQDLNNEQKSIGKEQLPNTSQKKPQASLKSELYFRDQKILKQFRPYLLSYMTIIFHFQKFVDFKNTQMASFILEKVFPQSRVYAYRFRRIKPKMLYINQMLMDDYKTVPQVVSKMIEKMEITQEEYLQSRKEVADKVYFGYLSLLKHNKKDKEFVQKGTIDVKDYQKKRENLLSNDEDMKVVYEVLELKKRRDDEKKIANKQKMNQRKIQRRKEWQQQRRLQQIKQKRLNTNYHIRILLTYIYSKNYDLINSQQHINTLAQSVYLAYEMDSSSSNRDTIGPTTIEQIKINHQTTLRNFAHIKSFRFDVQLKRHTENFKTAQQCIEKEFIRQWYTRIITKIQMGQGPFNNFLREEAQNNQKNPKKFVENPQNLHLMVKLVLQLNEESQNLQEYNQYIRSNRYLRFRPNDFKWMIFSLKQTPDDVSARKTWPIIYFQNLLGKYQDWLNDQQNYIGKNSIQIFIELRKMDLQKQTPQVQPSEQKLPQEKEKGNEFANSDEKDGKN